MKFLASVLFNSTPSPQERTIVEEPFVSSIETSGIQLSEETAVTVAGPAILLEAVNVAFTIVLSPNNGTLKALATFLNEKMRLPSVTATIGEAFCANEFSM